VLLLPCILVAWTAIACAAPVAPAAPQTAEAAMRRALSATLQADGIAALHALRSVDPARLAPHDARTRSCILERLGARHVPMAPAADAFVAAVLATYEEYST
jgi:hypothetical protein